MKRNCAKKPAKNPKLFFAFILLLVAVLLGFGLTRQFLGQSDIFRVKKITYPKALVLPKESRAFDLIGENLFSLNLKDASRKIRQENPQLSKVRILRRLPDELIIEAELRSPVALVKLGDKYFYVDSEAAISSSNIQAGPLPVILGVVNRPGSLRVGQIYDDRNLKFGLEIVREIDRIALLKKLALAKVNVANLNRASFMFAGGIEVIIGEEKLKDKLQLLAALVSRLDKELAQVKYIDLRFKEPVIGKKP